MTLGPVRVIGAGVVVMPHVEEVQYSCCSYIYVYSYVCVDHMHMQLLFYLELITLLECIRKIVNSS